MPENYAVDFESNIDLHDNQIKNVLIDRVETDPEGVAGKVIFNTTDVALKYYNGTTWVTIAEGGSLADYQLLSAKDTAGGYAGLDENAKIIIGQLPTGATANTIPLIVATISDGAVLQYSESSGGFVARILGTVYTYRGSVDNYSDLPTEGLNAGDVYNIVNASENNNAGDNVAWTGSAWDPLGGTIDTSGFQTTSNMAQDLESPSTSTYPSTQAVSTAITTATAAVSTATTTLLATKVDKLSSEVTAGTYTKVTVNADGLVTEGGSLEATDIPDLSSTYIAVPRTAGTAGQVLAVNDAADGYEFVTPLQCLTATINGDGSTTSFPVTNNLGVMPACVTLVSSSGTVVNTNMVFTNETITVNFNTAPATGDSYTVYILG